MSYAVIDYTNKRWFSPVTAGDTLNELKILIPPCRDAKSIRYAKKIIKILNKEKIRKVVLNKDLLENKFICEELLDNKKYIITGRRLYKVLIYRILKDIENQMEISLKQTKVALLVNEYCVENIDLIKNIAKEVKSLIIITNNSDRYARIIDELFAKYGIVLKVYEKNKVNLKYVNIVINVDFDSSDMNQIVVAPNSLVICGFASNYQIKTKFSGIIIRDIDILPDITNNMKMDNLALCEAKIYNYLRKLKENDRVFEEQGYRINGFFGENGKIMGKEFQNLGKIILDK